jgi:pyrroline-5-carboxylate reductase
MKPVDNKNHMTQNILFLGCGKMGSIILNNLVEESGFEASKIKVIKKSDKKKIEGISYVKDFQKLDKNYRADLVFLCIKPQDAAEVLTEFSQAKIFHKNTIFISILAGKEIKFFENIFGKKAKIIRSMPNLPIQYSQGIFAYLANKNITKNELKNLEKIFANFGTSFALKNEKDFDLVTALFGSGPAYIFLMQEIFAEIAAQISKENADELVRKLFLGSSLMSQFAEENFAGLRESVTSNKGTTASGLAVLQKNSALKNLIKKTIAAAAKRSKDLSNG